MARKGKFIEIFTAAEADGFGAGYNVNEYRHLVVQVATAGGFDGTIKMLGSVSVNNPNWASPSPTEISAPKRVIDADDNSSATGSTGIAGDGLVKEFIVNTDNIKWFNAQITGRTAGRVTVNIYGVNDSRNF